MKVKMTREEVNAGRLIPNGWYKGVIENAEDGESNSGNAMLVVDIKVIGHPEYAGVTCRDWLGSWFRGADKFRRFIETMTGAPYDYNKEYNLTNDSLKGKQILFYNAQSTDDKGQPVNSVQDYKKAE